MRAACNPLDTCAARTALADRIYVQEQREEKVQNLTELEWGQHMLHQTCASTALAKGSWGSADQQQNGQPSKMRPAITSAPLDQNSASLEPEYRSCVHAQRGKMLQNLASSCTCSPSSTFCQHRFP